jgi:hypothetical protein
MDDFSLLLLHVCCTSFREVPFQLSRSSPVLNASTSALLPISMALPRGTVAEEGTRTGS